MNTILEKIKDNIVTKVVIGVLTFLVTNFVTQKDEQIIQEKENYSIEITKESYSTTEIMFDAKFLEMKNIYIDNDHTYQ